MIYHTRNGCQFKRNRTLLETYRSNPICPTSVLTVRGTLFFSLAVPQEPQPFDYETIVVRFNCINMSDRLFLKHNSRMLIAVIGGRRTLLMVAQDGIEPS